MLRKSGREKVLERGGVREHVHHSRRVITSEPRVVKPTRLKRGAVAPGPGVVERGDQGAHGVRRREVPGWTGCVRSLVLDVPLSGELGARGMRPRLVDACVRGRRVVGETHRRLGVPRPGLERVHPPGTRRVGGGDEVPPKHEPPIRPQRHRHGARPARVTRLLVLQKLLQDVGALLVHVNVRRPARGLCPEGSGELGDLLALLVEERRSERIRDYSHPPLVPQRVHQTRVAPVALPHVTRVHRARPVYPRRFTFLPVPYLIPSASHHLRAVTAGADAGVHFVPVELLKVEHRLVLVLEPHAPPPLELLGAFRGPSRVQSLC